MSQREDEMVFVPEQFSGKVRLFPLPNLVLFPHVIQPLHVFEPRYVDLLHEALQHDRLIAMVLLDSSWEQDYEGRPPIASIACLGRVLTWQAQENSQYNLLLLGLRRVRVTRELPPDKAFREADAVVLEDDYPAARAENRPALHRKLIAAFEAMLPRLEDVAELFNQLSVNSISLGALTDVISYAIDLSVPAKQALLSEPNVDRRAKMLLAHLKKASGKTAEHPVATRFPPAFSTN